MVKEYTQSVFELLKAGEKPEQVFKGLKKVLETRGHERLHAHILRALARRFGAGTYAAAPAVTLANLDDKKKYAAAVADALKELGADQTDAVFNEDKTIVGGFIAFNEHRSIDASYKSQLLNWYHLATKN